MWKKSFNRCYIQASAILKFKVAGCLNCSQCLSFDFKTSMCMWMVVAVWITFIANDKGIKEYKFNQWEFLCYGEGLGESRYPVGGRHLWIKYQGCCKYEIEQTNWRAYIYITTKHVKCGFFSKFIMLYSHLFWVFKTDLPANLAADWNASWQINEVNHNVWFFPKILPPQCF